MKSIVVSAAAVRALIKEMMASGPVPAWGSDEEATSLPAEVSPVVDPNAAVTDPGNEAFKPHDRMELRTALSSMVDTMSDDDAPEIYAAIKTAVDDMKEKDEEAMKKKDDTQLEEAIRLAIRKVLAEVGVYRDTGMSYSGPQTGAAADAGFEECEACGGEGFTEDGAECEACEGTGEVKSTKRKNEMMTDVGGASFDEIAKEMGYAGPPGARQAVQKALEKARFVVSMPEDEMEIITLTAMNDYIDLLNKSGDLAPADVQLMKDHPGIVSELDGFRFYLDKVLKTAQKSNQKLVNPVKD